MAGVQLSDDRRGERSVRRRRRRWWSLSALALIGLVTFVLVWFQPQKLFIDDRVEESIPNAAGEPVVVASGEFISLDHGTKGTATVLAFGSERRFLRLEGFDTSNGPALYLYLSANPAAGDEGAFDDEFVNLGRLKGNQGSQNYELPRGTDLRRFATVLVWCDRFDSAFGAADLALV